MGEFVAMLMSRCLCNQRRAIQGQLNIPLNAKGKEQAAKLADLCEDFPLTEIHSSDLARAKETAEAVAARHQCPPIKVSEALRERHYGLLQGHPYPDDEVLPPDMEPLKALDQRFLNWLTGLLAPGRSISSTSAKPGSVEPDPDGQVIMVATHDGILRSLRRSALAEAPHPVLGYIEVAPGLELMEFMGNTSLAILRVWTGDEGSLRSRIEAWGWRGVT